MKKLFKTLTLSLFTLMASNAMAALKWQDFSQTAFEAAQKSGKKIVLGFHKKGCGTCTAQDEALSAALPPNQDFVAFRVERKDEKLESVYKAFGLSKKQWASLILLNGEKEVARIAPFNTDTDDIRDFAKRLGE